MFSTVEELNREIDQFQENMNGTNGIIEHLDSVQTILAENSKDVVEAKKKFTDIIGKINEIDKNIKTILAENSKDVVEAKKKFTDIIGKINEIDKNIKTIKLTSILTAVLAAASILIQFI